MHLSLTHGSVEHVDELLRDGELREVPVHLDHLQRRRPSHSALHVTADRQGHRRVTGAVNQSARDLHAVEDVPVIPEENGSGHGQCGVGLHPLEVVPELFDCWWVVGPNEEWDEGLGP